MNQYDDLPSTQPEEQRAPAAPSARRGRPARGPRVSNVLLLVVFLIGLCLLLYPSVSDLINEKNHSRIIASHQQSLEKLDDTTRAELLQRAQDYNTELAQSPTHWFLSDAERALYNNLLDPFGTGMMGYLEIPSLQTQLPIYHGVSADVLQVGVGHIEGSSLPVGGESSHCVLSGHRGLPSARLLSDLDQMEVGDLFLLHVLDETLAYTVDDIRVVEPKEMESLGITQGKDYCTLVTCTPYGVNTHRLLVRGVRTPYTPEVQQQEAAAAAAAQSHWQRLIPFGVAFVLVALLVVLLVCNSKRKGKER